MNGEKHPGRSPEFLSRLHDGEVDAGERAHFEAHRAHCAECRRAAREFEDALALFRSARSKPPQPDLAARILRKIQTSSPARAPFSRRFRMDLGWAALVLTGIFALLLTTPIAIHRDEPPILVSLPTPAPAPVSSDRTAEAAPQAAPESDRLSRDAAARRDRPASVPPPPLASNMPRPAEPPAPAPEVAADEKEYDAQSGGAATSQRRPALAAEAGRASGGEESTSTAAAAPAAALRLRIESIDGFGAAPSLLSSERIALPASFRGHEFILNVDSQGNVSGVGPAPSRERREAQAVPVTAPTALSQLRFEPGNRPRRLLVRFE
jgi:hypothetical protein